MFKQQKNISPIFQGCGLFLFFESGQSVSQKWRIWFQGVATNISYYHRFQHTQNSTTIHCCKMLPSKLHTCRFLGNYIRVLESVHCTNTTFYLKKPTLTLYNIRCFLLGLKFLFILLSAFLHTSEEMLSETDASIRHLSFLFESNCSKKRR